MQGIQFRPGYLTDSLLGGGIDHFGEFVSGNQMVNMQLAWQLDLLH